MPWLFIVIAALWVVIGVAGNKKKQQARAEAEKQAAQQRQQQAATPSDPPPRPAAPFSPYFTDEEPQRTQPAQRPPLASAPRPGMVAPPKAKEQATVAVRMQEGLQSTLTEIQQTQRHTLTPSGKIGHAHQETSMTGIEADCPPSAEAVKRAQELLKSAGARKPAGAAGASSAAYAGMPAFNWKPDAVLNGMVYAEILQKPKALRR